MALVEKIELGSNGWNTIHYTDGTKYIGYTKNNEIREGLGTFYDLNNELHRGLWQDDEIIEVLEEAEYNLKVNESLQNPHHW